MIQRRFEHSNNPLFECADGVLLLPFGRRSYLPAIVEAWSGEQVSLDETTDRIVYQLRGAPGPVTLLYSGMGSPAAANALEMAVANGARRVVVLGACGGVDDRVEVGDLIVVTGAVRGEGTSRYYAPPEFPAALGFELSSRLWQAALSAYDGTCRRGVVYTTDAGYRQGPEVYERYAGLIIGVDSECAAVAVVGARLGIEVAALLFCTDNLTLASETDKYYSGLADARVCRAFEAGQAAAINVLTQASG
jgi:uridine phosphorylase